MGITSTPSRNLSHSWRRSGRRAALRRPSGSQHWPTEPRRACPKGPCPRRRRREQRRASKQYPEADTAMGPPRGASATVRLASLANGAATSMPERAMPAPEAAEAAPRLDCRQASRASRARRRADATTHVLAKKGESTVTPVHAFNLEVHEVDLRGARTRFLLDSLETTLCAVRTMRTGSRPRPTRRRTNKINWRRRRPLRLLTAGSRRCGLSRFLPQSLGGGSGGGRSPGRKSCVVVRYQIEPCARV